MKRQILVLSILLLIPVYVSAHPSHPDKEGCHVCWTNCNKWDMQRGKKHCHLGKEESPSVTLVNEDSDSRDLLFQISKCSVVKGNLSRLECYDSLAESSGAYRPKLLSEKTTERGGWIVSETINPFDDTTTITLVLEAESRSSRLGRNIYLVLRCMSNNTEAYINWKDYLGGEAIVKTRVDRLEPLEFKWLLSNDATATFYPFDTIEFIKELSKAQQLTAQVTPYHDDPVTGFFNLKGLSEALIPLEKTCDWEKKLTENTQQEQELQKEIEESVDKENMKKIDNLNIRLLPKNGELNNPLN